MLQPTKGWQLSQVVGHRIGASKLVPTIAVDRYLSSTVAGWQFVVHEECAAFIHFAFTIPGEYSIHPTLQVISPDALRLPARQNPLRSDLLMHTFTCVILVLPFPGVYRCEAAARRSRKWARASAPTSTTIASTIRRTLEVSEAHKARRPMRPSHTPCESPPCVHSLEARSAVQ